MGFVVAAVHCNTVRAILDKLVARIHEEDAGRKWEHLEEHGKVTVVMRCMVDMVVNMKAGPVRQRDGRKVIEDEMGVENSVGLAVVGCSSAGWIGQPRGNCSLFWHWWRS